MLPSPTRPRRRRALAAASLLALGVGAALAWRVLSRDGARDRREVVPSPATPPGTGRTGTEASAAPASAPPVPTPAAGATTTAPPARSSGGVPPGLRTPFGEDLSDPARVAARLREALAAEPRDWRRVGDLLAIHEGRLDDAVLAALVEAVRHPGDATGAGAAWARIRDPRAAAALLPHLAEARADPAAWSVVAQALTAAARVPGAERTLVVTALRALLDANPQDVAVVRTIAGVGGPDALEALIAVARDPAMGVQLARGALRDVDLRREPGAGERLAAALKDPAASPGALLALTDLAFGGPGSEEVVLALLALDVEGRPPEVRRAAYEALSRVGDDRGWDHLLAAAQGSGDRAEDARHAVALARSASPAVRARLVETARSSTDDDLRVRLAEGLGRLGEPAGVPILAAWVESGSDALRRGSLAGLARYGPRAASAVEALGRAYGSGDEGLRSQVVTTLGEIGTPEARRLLEQARVAETSPAVRKVAEAVLRNLDAGGKKSP